MRPKKHPHADLNRNIPLYFFIGLTLSLFLTWRLFEHKTYEKTTEFTKVLKVVNDFEEEVPITQQLTTQPPPPPPSAPTVIEVVEDITEVEETVISSTEVSQNTRIEDVIISVEDVEVEEVEEEISVPFAAIENVPIFPGCENLANEEERKACFNRKMQEHILQNFSYPETALEMGITGRVFLKFEIDAQGWVSNIQKRGPDRLLEEEAVRIISCLPQVTPGMQRNRPVKVLYSIPINFVLQ